MNTSFQRTTASDEWYTPRELIESLGEFELDPCAPVHPLWPTAKTMYNIENDGLALDWGGARVWLNPPYSQPLLTRFCEKFADNGNGVALLFGRTGNKVFQEIMLPRADAVLFLRRRIKFYRPDGSQAGSGGCDSVLFAFGWRNAGALQESGLEGVFVPLKGAGRINTKTLFEI